MEVKMTEVDKILNILKALGCKIYINSNKKLRITNQNKIPSNVLEQIKVYEPEIRNKISLRVNSGVGSELAILLKRYGVVLQEVCSCNNKLDMLDAKGADWAKQNSVEIIREMKKEAMLNKLPFSDKAAKILLKRAISRSIQQSANFS
jgi:hypothetical protein